MKLILIYKSIHLQGETNHLACYGKQTLMLFFIVRWVTSIRNNHFAVVISKMQTDGGREEDLASCYRLV